MKILVLSRSEFVRYCHREHTDVSYGISIRDCDSYKQAIPKVAEFNGVKFILYLRFDDVESGDNAFTENHADAIKRFLTIHNPETLIVQCDAGISRSAWIAAAISKYCNGDDSYYFKHKNPNMLCYRLMLNSLMNEDSNYL